MSDAFVQTDDDDDDGFEVSRVSVNASQEYQSRIKANRRRCYCSSEPLSLQPTGEGQLSFFLL